MNTVLSELLIEENIMVLSPENKGILSFATKEWCHMISEGVV